MAQRVPYTLGDDRRIGVTRTPNQIHGQIKATFRFSNLARGVPDHVHGGALGAVYLALAPELKTESCPSAIELSYKVKSVLGEEITLELANNRNENKGSHLVARGALISFGGEELSRATVSLAPLAELGTPLVSQAKYAGVLRLILLKTMTPVPVPDFRDGGARQVFPDTGQVHFDFHDNARMLMEGFLEPKGVGSTQLLHCLLHCDPDRCVSDAVLKKDGTKMILPHTGLWLSESALFTAIDEAMGAGVNYSFPVPLMTGSLSIKYLNRISLDHGPPVLYMRVQVNPRIPSSRRVSVEICVHAIVGPVDKSPSSLPLVATGSAVFILLTQHTKL